LVFCTPFRHLCQIKDDIERLLSVLVDTRAVPVSQSWVHFEEGVDAFTGESCEEDEGPDLGSVLALVAEPDWHFALEVYNIVEQQDLVRHAWVLPAAFGLAEGS